jgi:3-methyladenine DNA glycosylase AlkD
MKCFAPSPLALKMAKQWVKSKKEFIRRSGFVLLACYGFSRKNEGNEIFESFFEYILKYANDDRNFVKKANNWALRSIGKRNSDLKQKAIEVASELLKMESLSARWIAKDELRELQSDKVKIQDYPRDIYRP